MRRIIGAGGLWVTEFTLTYDGRPSYKVSVREFVDGRVTRETQYFGDPFEPGASRAHSVERMCLRRVGRLASATPDQTIPFGLAVF